MTLTESIRLLYQMLDETLRRAEKARELAGEVRARARETSWLYGSEDHPEGHRELFDKVWHTNNEAADALEAAAANTEEVVAFHRWLLEQHTSHPSRFFHHDGRALCMSCRVFVPCEHLKGLLRLYRIEVGE